LVFPDRVIDPAHKGGDVRVEVVVISRPAMIGAELFIPAAMNGFIANFAISFVGFHNPEV